MKLSSPDEAKALRTMAGLANATAPAAAPALSAARRVNKRAAAAAALWSIFVILTFLLFHRGPWAHREYCFDDRGNPRRLFVPANYDNLFTAGQWGDITIPHWGSEAGVKNGTEHGVAPFPAGSGDRLSRRLHTAVMTAN